MTSLKNKINIRLASITDLSEIKKLYKEVTYDINNVKKINMLWNEVYPICVLESDINNEELYVIEIDSKIIGSFSLSTFDNPEYHVINWNSINKKWIYLNRLVILPSYQGKGYAKYAIKYVEQYAIKENYQVIRLTVHEDNKYAIGLYEKFGFIKIKDSNWVLDGEIFFGFEKEIIKAI